MNDRTSRWIPWTSADLLDPLTAFSMRHAADVEQRERLMEAPPRSSDAEILKRVEQRIAADDRLRDSDIHVDAVYDGVVLLGGSAATARAHARAFEDAASVPGVRRVATEITTDETQDAA